MAYGDFKHLARRTASDKVAGDKAFNITKKPKYDGYQRGLASMFHKCLCKKSKYGGVTTLANQLPFKNQITQNQQLAKELHKPIIRKFKNIAVCSTFKENIWGADLADMQLISKFNKGIRFSLCVIDIYSNYACVVPLKR